MEPIKIYDQRIQARVDAIVSDLWKFYPDGTIYGLNRLHKTLSNKVGEIWQDVGYPTREDFLGAYGFTVDNPKGGGGDAGGRPVTATPEAAEELIQELLSRYEGMEKPKALGILLHDNPDIKGRMKSFQNKSQEMFGMTWAKYLQERGVLAGKKTSSASDALDRRDDIEAMIEDLKECYEGDPNKPSTVKALKLAHPEYAEELDLLSKGCEQLFGETTAKYLKSIGVLKASASAVIPASNIDAIITDLKGRFSRFANDDKPSSWTALINAVPDIANEVKAAKKTWEQANTGKFVEELKRLGIMQMSFADQRRAMVRNAGIMDLLKIWNEANGPALIDACDEKFGKLIPGGIVAVDVEHNLQLEESIVCFSTPDCPKELIDAPDDLALRFAARDFKLFIETTDGSPLLSKDVPLTDEFKALEDAAAGFAAEPSLRARVGARVVSVSKLDPGLLSGNEPALVQIQLLKAMPLESQTLLHMIYAAGLITERDLLMGDEWRYRDYSQSPIGSEITFSAPEVPAPEIKRPQPNQEKETATQPVADKPEEEASIADSAPAKDRPVVGSPSIPSIGISTKDTMFSTKVSSKISLNFSNKK